METQLRNSTLESYKELLTVGVTPTNEISKLINFIIPMARGEMELEDFAEQFNREREHYFFILEKIGDLERNLQFELINQ